MLTKLTWLFFTPPPPPQKSNNAISLFIEGKVIKQEKCIKYLRMHMDSHPNWIYQIQKIKRKIRILSRIRRFDFINPYTVVLYFSLSFPYLWSSSNGLGKYELNYLTTFYSFTEENCSDNYIFQVRCPFNSSFF